jgi:hypothetical protein
MLPLLRTSVDIERPRIEDSVPDNHSSEIINGVATNFGRNIFSQLQRRQARPELASFSPRF